jgi:hypothetical protein
VKLKGMQLRGIHVKIEYKTIYEEKEIFEFEF